jgi:cytochrome b
MPAVPNAPPPHPVWDLPVRLFHWSLLLTVATAAISGFLLPANWLNLHLAAGTVLIVLLLFRLVWGFTGSTYSRFRSFAYSPGEVAHYVRGLVAGKATHSTGHNPVGALMIFALLLILAIIAVTGVMVAGGAEKQGPLKAFVSYATGSASRELHEILAWLLLVLIAGHVLGIIIESRRSKINLARRMVAGGVPPAHEPPIAQARLPAFAMSAIALAIASGGSAYALWRAPAPMIPSEALDAAYARDCGDCHIPYHPSLRSRAAWASIMGNLEDHFGEDASLDAAQAARLSDYLQRNAAENWDTRAANVFRADEPLRIIETDFWKRRHAEIPVSVFQQKNVGTKSNCEACHGDARAGLFAAQAINIPKE